MQGILKHVGGKYWPWPDDHIRETRSRGPSIRIAPDSVPDLARPYPVVFVHPRGTFHVTKGTINDLFDECKNEGHVAQDTDLTDYVEMGLSKLAFIQVFASLDENDKKEFKRLVKKYGIEFAPAVTHYSWITSTQVVVSGNEGWETVEALRRMGHEAEPVEVIHEEAS